MELLVTLLILIIFLISTIFILKPFFSKGERKNKNEK
tara:strand:+ start:149 stop:259 length:111 start_codon:yes stop_codon:yes gene_type:complete